MSISTDVTLRQATLEDAEASGQICYAAFKRIAEQHNFPPDWPDVDFTVQFLRRLLSHPMFYGVVALADGRIVGSNFLDERAQIAGLGPITIDPAVQNARLGRTLMEHALERAWSQGRAGVRLVQAAYHGRSLGLYAKLGFAAREPLSCMQGKPSVQSFAGYTVRPATAADVPACNDLGKRVHGYERGRELSDAIAADTAMVVERDSCVTGYATMIGFGGHATCETNTDLKALIAATPEIAGPGLLLPTRNWDVFRWCLDSGLKVVQPMTYMSIGLYNEPQGAYLPSVLL